MGDDTSACLMPFLMTLNNWRQHPVSRLRRGVVMYSYAVILSALCASCSEAWVMVPPRGCDKPGRRWCQQLSSHRNSCGRRRPLSPPSRGRGQPAVSQSADAQAEGTEPPPLPPLERAPVAAVEAGGRRDTSRSVSWQEQFACLRNDATDPWTARRADDSSSRASGSAPAPSLGISGDKDGSSGQGAMGGGAAEREEVVGGESPLTATETETAVPEETGTSRLLQCLLSWRFCSVLSVQRNSATNGQPQAPLLFRIRFRHSRLRPLSV